MQAMTQLPAVVADPRVTVTDDAAAVLLAACTKAMLTEHYLPGVPSRIS
jgi:hypothetical protein